MCDTKREFIEFILGVSAMRHSTVCTAKIKGTLFPFGAYKNSSPKFLNLVTVCEKLSQMLVLFSTIKIYCGQKHNKNDTRLNININIIF